eukprot:1194784-Prorocentrum_minimum.AAC.6
MTGGGLACAAVAAGAAKVVLVSRRGFKRREFETEAAFFGTKGMHRFRVRTHRESSGRKWGTRGTHGEKRGRVSGVLGVMHRFRVRARRCRTN